MALDAPVTATEPSILIASVGSAAEWSSGIHSGRSVVVGFEVVLTLVSCSEDILLVPNSPPST